MDEQGDLHRAKVVHALEGHTGSVRAHSSTLLIKRCPFIHVLMCLPKYLTRCLDQHAGAHSVVGGEQKMVGERFSRWHDKHMASVHAGALLLLPAP